MMFGNLAIFMSIKQLWHLQFCKHNFLLQCLLLGIISPETSASNTHNTSKKKKTPRTEVPKCSLVYHGD